MAIPDGKYRARGVAAALSEAGTGTKQVVVELELLDVDPGEAGDNRHWWYGYFSDRAWERTVEALRALGWEGDDLSDLSGINRSEVFAVLKTEVYEGSPNQKVAFINKLGDLPVKNQLSADQAKVFAAEMRGKIRAFDSSGGRPKNNGSPNKPKGQQAMPGTGRPSKGIHGDDDIPF
jgi:hypothetical protein